MDFGKCVSNTVDYELAEASKKQFRALKRQIDRTIRSVVEDGIRDGSIASGRDPKVITFTLTGALNGIARWYDPDGELSSEEIAHASVEILVNGLAPRPEGNTK